MGLADPLCHHLLHIRAHPRHVGQVRDAPARRLRWGHAGVSEVTGSLQYLQHFSSNQLSERDAIIPSKRIDVETGSAQVIDPNDEAGHIGHCHQCLRQLRAHDMRRLSPGYGQIGDRHRSPGSFERSAEVGHPAVESSAETGPARSRISYALREAVSQCEQADTTTTRNRC